MKRYRLRGVGVYGRVLWLALVSCKRHFLHMCVAADIANLPFLIEAQSDRATLIMPIPHKVSGSRINICSGGVLPGAQLSGCIPVKWTGKKIMNPQTLF